MVLVGVRGISFYFFKGSLKGLDLNDGIQWVAGSVCKRIVSGSVLCNIHRFSTKIAWCDFLAGVLTFQLLPVGGKVPIVCPSMLMYQLRSSSLYPLALRWDLTWNSVSCGARHALCETWHLMLTSSSLVFFLSLKDTSKFLIHFRWV